MDLKEIKVDPALVEHGGWVSDIPGMGDLELHVRPLSGNFKYLRLISKLMRGLPKLNRIGGLPDEDAMDRITAKCLLETVLLGWRNLKDGGEDVPYTPETARMLMIEPEFRDFREAVAQAANMVTNQRIVDQEDAAKNS